MSSVAYQDLSPDTQDGDGDWRGSSPKVRSVDEVEREHNLFKARMEILRSDLQEQQQRQET